MGYRVANNYDEDAECVWRRHVAALPCRRRVLLRLRQVLILAVTVGLPVLLIGGGLRPF